MSFMFLLPLALALTAFPYKSSQRDYGAGRDALADEIKPAIVIIGRSQQHAHAENFLERNGYKRANFRISPGL